MNLPSRTRPVRSLWILLAGTGLYLGLTHALGSLTGQRLVDGSIGVVLGLYICSRPAGNAVDLLFYQRGELQRLTSGWRGIGWLALNLLVLFAGWLVIVVGAVRFAARPV